MLELAIVQEQLDMRFPNLSSLESVAYQVSHQMERLIYSGVLTHLAAATLVAYLFLLVQRRRAT